MLHQSYCSTLNNTSWLFFSSYLLVINTNNKLTLQHQIKIACYHIKFIYIYIYNLPIPKFNLYRNIFGLLTLMNQTVPKIHFLLYYWIHYVSYKLPIPNFNLGHDLITQIVCPKGKHRIIFDWWMVSLIIYLAKMYSCYLNLILLWI